MFIKNDVICCKVRFYYCVLFSNYKCFNPFGKNSQRTVRTVSSDIINRLSFIKTAVPLLSLSTVYLVEIYKLLLWCVITSRWRFLTSCGSCWINKHCKQKCFCSHVIVCHGYPLYHDERRLRSCIFHFHFIDIGLHHCSYLCLTKQR